VYFVENILPQIFLFLYDFLVTLMCDLHQVVILWSQQYLLQWITEVEDVSAT